MRELPKYRQPLPGNGHSGLGVTWYENELQWLKIRSTATDPDNFFDSYSEWVANAEKQIRELQGVGASLVKVSMIGDDFLAWCRDTGQENCGATRSAFVAEAMADRASATLH